MTPQLPRFWCLFLSYQQQKNHLRRGSCDVTQYGGLSLRCHRVTVYWDLSELINFIRLLKSSRNKKDLNDVTAAPFLVFFLLLAAEKKTPKTGQLWRHWGSSYFDTTLELPRAAFLNPPDEKLINHTSVHCAFLQTERIFKVGFCCIISHFLSTPCSFLNRYGFYFTYLPKVNFTE